MVPALATRTSAVLLPDCKTDDTVAPRVESTSFITHPRSRTSQCNGKDMNENIQEKEVCLMLHYMMPTGDESTPQPRQDAKCIIKVNGSIMREFANTKHSYDKKYFVISP